MGNVFTFFHHGTGSHRTRRDDEIVKVFGDNCAGVQTQDFLITDGPGALPPKPTENIRQKMTDKQFLKSMSKDVRKAFKAMQKRYRHVSGSHSIFTDGSGKQLKKGRTSKWWHTPGKTITNIDQPYAEVKYLEVDTPVVGQKTSNLLTNAQLGGLTGQGWDDNIRRSIWALLNSWEWDGNFMLKQVRNSQITSDITREFASRYKKENFLYSFMRDRLQVKGIPPNIENVPFQYPHQTKWKFAEGGTINMIGWSRGAVTCLRLATWIYYLFYTSNIKINIFAVDPVPGFDAYKNLGDARKITPVVKNLVIILAKDERRSGMHPLDAKELQVEDTTKTNLLFIPFPGEHATMVRQKGGSGGALNDVADIIKYLAWKFLSKKGTKFKSDFGFKWISNTFLLSLYSDVALNKEKYIAHGKSAHRLQQKYGGMYDRGLRKSGYGDSDIFVNDHHRDLFMVSLPNLWNYFFTSGGSGYPKYFDTKSTVGQALSMVSTSAPSVLSWLSQFAPVFLETATATINYSTIPYTKLPYIPRRNIFPPPMPRGKRWRVEKTGILDTVGLCMKMNPVRFKGNNEEILKVLLRNN